MMQNIKWYTLFVAVFLLPSAMDGDFLHSWGEREKEYLGGVSGNGDDRDAGQKDREEDQQELSVS